MDDFNNKYMMRCLQLAQNGKGETSPNPMVGAVIVHNDRIIGEGFHRKAGEPHAEVNAITSVKEADRHLLSRSTIYVNLEPCSHYGKTPPCAELIIREQIPRVVVACPDPFPEVSGRGMRMLKDAGVEVVTGVMEKEARELNHAFITLHEKKRPYITLKWAESADGFIDKIRKDYSEPAIKLSDPATSRLVHKLRAESAAIMVGTNTALLDNPSLNVRHWSGKSPIRIVLDQHLSIPKHFHLLDDSTETLVFTEQERESTPNTTYIIIDFSENVIPQILHELTKRKINSLLVEGGSQLLNSFIQLDCWDKIQVEKTSLTLGNGIAAPILPDNVAEKHSALHSSISFFERKKTSNDSKIL